MKRILLIIIITFCIVQLSAQHPAPPQRQPLAITGGTLHTITHGVIPGGTVLIEHGLITAVGQDVEIPDNALVIDASGKEIYPGFIHGRSILGLMEIARTTESTDIEEFGDINPNIRAQVAFHPASEHLPVAAVHGITTVVPTPRGGIVAGMPAAMMTDGWTWEAMTVREGLAMAIYWPSMNNSRQYAEAMQKLQEAFDKARRYMHARKAQNAGSNQHHAIDIRWEAMIPVLERKMSVHITVNDLKQIQAALLWAEQEALDVVLVGGRDIGLAAEQLAEKNIPVMLSGVISGPAQQWHAYDEAYTTALRLYEAGVTFCIAGDPGPASAYRLPHHAAAAVAFGLPEKTALEAITINAARILGIDDLLGSLEPGKHATLFISNGNPLEIWTRIEQVFIHGRKIDMTDKHLHLYKQYKEKHRQQFFDQ
ncbi:MAG: amidohydrolase family protein [Bacteroidales bacterium]|nr:amidohydrolase family protein [Bacteroidales bacterium]